MLWYYVEAGKQTGPVTEEQLRELVQSGKIQGDTLVWREGMAQWQPYRDIAQTTGTLPPPLQPPPSAQGPASGDQAVCSQCGNIVPRSATVQYGTVVVCNLCQPGFVQRMQASGGVSQLTEVQYGGFWIRFGAKSLDGLIVGVILGIPMMLIFAGTGMLHHSRNPGPEMLMANIIINILSYAVSLTYNTFFLGKFGATPGKMVCGLKVITDDGSPITYGRAFGRSAAEILSSLVCLIGYIIAAFDDEKRALHDHLASTRVIRSR